MEEVASAAPPPRPQGNRRRRGVLGGLVVMAVGFAFLLPALGIGSATSYLFVALGAAFGIAYLVGRNPYVYVIPSMTFIALGIGQLVPEWLALTDDVAGAVFLASLAIGFAAAFLIRPVRRWPLVPSAVLAFVALAEVFASGVIVPPAMQPFFVPVVLLVVGAYLIVGPRAAE